MRTPTLERKIHDGRGTQRLYRFDNGYGASVVRSPYSYGGDQGLWELAVLTFNGGSIEDFDLSYSTPITHDVIGHLEDYEVDELLARIEALEQRGTP
jgi:hypothetical protein